MEGFYVIFNRAEKTIQFAVSKCNVIDESAVRSYIQGNISLSGNVPYTLYCPYQMIQFCRTKVPSRLIIQVCDPGISWPSCLYQSPNNRIKTN